MSEAGKEDHNLKIVNASVVIEINDDGDDDDDDVVILGSQPFQNLNNSLAANEPSSPTSNNNGLTDLNQLAAVMHHKILEVLCGTGYGLEIHQILTAMRHFTAWSYRYYDKHTKSLPNCLRLSRNLLTKMNFFHTISKHCNDNEDYLHGMVKLLTLYITVELRLINDVKQQDQRQNSQLANRIVYLLRVYLNNPQKDGLNGYVLATLVRLPNLHGGNEIMLKVFQELLTFRYRLVQNKFPDNLYIQYIIVFSKWLKLVPDYRERQRIIEFAEEFMQPCRTLCNNILYAPYLPVYQKHSTATRIILYHLKTLDNLKNASIGDCSASSFSSDMLTLRDEGGEGDSLKTGTNTNGNLPDLYQIFYKQNPVQLKSNEIIDLTNEEALQAAKCNSIFHNIKLDTEEEQWLKDFHITSSSLNPLNHNLFHVKQNEPPTNQETIELSESDSDSTQLFSVDLPFEDNISDVSDSYDDLDDPTLIALRLPCDNLRTYSNKRSTKASANSNHLNEISAVSLQNTTLKVDKAINTDQSTAIESPYDIPIIQNIAIEENDNISSKPPAINHLTNDSDILVNSSAKSNINSSDKDMPRIVASFSCRRDSIHILSSPVYDMDDDDNDSHRNIDADVSEQGKLVDDGSLNYFLKKLQHVKTSVNAVSQNPRVKGKFNETKTRKCLAAEQFNMPSIGGKAAYHSIKNQNRKPLLKHRPNVHNRCSPLLFPSSSERVLPNAAGSTSTSVSTSTSSSINMEALKELAQQEHIAAAPAVFRNYSLLPLQMDGQPKSKYNPSTYPLHQTVCHPHLPSYTQPSSNQRYVSRAKATKSTAKKSNTTGQRRRPRLSKTSARPMQDKHSIASKTLSASGYQRTLDNNAAAAAAEHDDDSNTNSSATMQQLLNDPKLKSICKIIIEKSAEMQEYLSRQQQQQQQPQEAEAEEEQLLQPGLPELTEAATLAAKDTPPPQSHEEVEKQSDHAADEDLQPNKTEHVIEPEENENSNKQSQPPSTAFADDREDVINHIQERLIEETEQSASHKQSTNSPSDLLDNAPNACRPDELLLLAKNDAKTVTKTASSSTYPEEMPNDHPTLATSVFADNEKYTGTELNSTDMELISDLAELLPTISNENTTEILAAEIPTKPKELAPLFDSLQNISVAEPAAAVPPPISVDSGLMKTNSDLSHPHAHQLNNNCDTIVPFLGNFVTPVIDIMDKKADAANTCIDLQTKADKQDEQNSNEILQTAFTNSITSQNYADLAVQKDEGPNDVDTTLLDVAADVQATKAFRIRVKRTKLLKSQTTVACNTNKLDDNNPASGTTMMKSILKKANSTQGGKPNRKVRFADDVYKKCIFEEAAAAAAMNGNKLNAKPKTKLPKDSMSSPYKPFRGVPCGMPLIKRTNFNKSKENTLRANETLVLFQNIKLDTPPFAKFGLNKLSTDLKKPPAKANKSKTQMLKSVLDYRENLYHPIKLNSTTAKGPNSPAASSAKEMLKAYVDNYPAQPLVPNVKANEQTPLLAVKKRRRRRKNELINESPPMPPSTSINNNNINTIKNHNNNNNNNNTIISNKVQQSRQQQHTAANKSNANDYLVSAEMEAGVVNEVDVFSEQLLQPIPDVNDSLLGAISNERSSIGSASSLRDEYMCIEATDTVPANIFNDESRDAAPTPSSLSLNNYPNNSNTVTTTIASTIPHPNEHYAFIHNYDYDMPNASGSSSSTTLEKLNTIQQISTSTNSMTVQSKYMDTASSLNTITSTSLSKGNEGGVKYANYANDAKSDKMHHFHYAKFHNELKPNAKHATDADSPRFLKGLCYPNQKDVVKQSKEDGSSKNAFLAYATQNNVQGTTKTNTNAVAKTEHICSSMKPKVSRKRKLQDASLPLSASNAKISKTTKSYGQLSGKHSTPSFPVNIPIGKIISPKDSSSITPMPSSGLGEKIKKPKERNININMPAKIKKSSANTLTKEMPNKNSLKPNTSESNVHTSGQKRLDDVRASIATANKPQTKKHNSDNKLKTAVKAAGSSLQGKTNTTNSLTSSYSTNPSKVPTSNYQNGGKGIDSILQTRQHPNAVDAKLLRLLKAKKKKKCIDKATDDNTKSQHVNRLNPANNLSTRKTTTTTTTNSLLSSSTAEEKNGGIAIKQRWTPANASSMPALVPTTLLSPLSVYSSTSPLPSSSSSLMSSPLSFPSPLSSTSPRAGTTTTAAANGIASNLNTASNKVMKKPTSKSIPTAASTKTSSLDTTSTTTTALSSLISPSCLTTPSIQYPRKPTTFQVNKKLYHKNNNNHINSDNNRNNNNNNNNNIYNNNHNHHHNNNIINNNSSSSSSSCNMYN